MVFNRRGEESEWSRIARGTPTRETSREDAGDSPAEQAAPAAQSGPIARQPVQDVNVTVSRQQQRTASSDLSDEVESIIGEQSTFEGNFRSESSVRVRGAVQGELESKRAVFIEERAHINAKVTGASIVVAGEIDGQLHCAGRVEIKPTGRVTGEIHAGTLIMHEGAFFEGQLKMVKPSE